MSLVVDEHRQYVGDAVRIDAFRRAIHAAVRTGATVVDLASGTGVLGLIACEAGARRVYSIELGGMIEVARAVAAANGFADRIVFIRGVSTDVTLPERADVIVTDQVGQFGFDAGLLEYGSDARERFLKPGGVMLPAAVDLWLAPVESEELHGQAGFWNQRPAGFDFAPAGRWAVNTGYPTTLSAASLLSDAACGVSLDMSRATADPFTIGATTTAGRAGILHGIGGWFSATLCPGVIATNSPLAPARVNRRNVFFPIESPVPIVKGDVVSVAIHVMPVDTIVTWRVDVAGAGGERKGHARQSTMSGMLLCREDLRRMDPRFVPTLTPRGIARLSVLTLCDGVRPLAEIERAVYDRHADLFRSREEAAAFVSEVVTRYSR